MARAGSKERPAAPGPDLESADIPTMMGPAGDGEVDSPRMSPSDASGASRDHLLSSNSGGPEVADRLENFLGGELADESAPQSSTEDCVEKTNTDIANPEEKRRHQSIMRDQEMSSLDHKTTIVSQVVEHRYFSAFFMVLTFYALFGQDIDQTLGNRDSQFGMQITTTVVFFLFWLEILLQSLGKKTYFPRGYFWLDVIAAFSLLPDTYFLQITSGGSNEFVAGRSSRLTKIIRVATRSSKITRLNRMMKIVRVASLIPKLNQFCGKKVETSDMERLLVKKLRRIFMFLDEEATGFVPRAAAQKCIRKMGDGTNSTTTAGFWAAKRTMKRPYLGREGTQGQTSERLSELTQGATDSVGLGGENAPNDVPIDLEDCIDFDEFMTLMKENSEVWTKVTKACEQQLRKGNNMQTMTARHSEYIGVKVALGVIILLVVLNFVQVTTEDKSVENTLISLNSIVRNLHGNVSVGGQIPISVRRLVDVWAQRSAGNEQSREVLYLDLHRQVYCDSFVGGRGDDCTFSADDPRPLYWGQPSLVSRLSDELSDDGYRGQDIAIYYVDTFGKVAHPGDYNSDAELEASIDAVAVINIRGQIEEEGLMSLLNTMFVIVIILGGITALTRDLSFISKHLLKPLSELADEMENIVQLQMAGCSQPETKEETKEDGFKGVVSEVRLIRRTFDNMKMAIKSWGKYVPWPVVQMLLAASVEASIDVKEKEVSIYFSDIASFTTIVESIPPESSLKLLSRYFNDMSKIIDEHGGIVLEYIGDAIMAIYGAPMRNPDHPRASVLAAIRMLHALDKMNEWCIEKKLPEVKIRCGVHTGKVLVGNMGFQSRMKYGIVGEEGNIPGRLEELNKNYSTKMMISENTYRKLPPHAFIARPIDYVYLRPEDAQKISEPIFEVLGQERQSARCASLFAIMEKHAEAMDLYRTQSFKQASVVFTQVSNSMLDLNGEEDTPANIMRKRCDIYAQQPPAPNWDGVWDRSEKE